MKFLCVPCDTPMKLQAVGPPERGSLSVVYACPECGYEMAMLTNAYETQVVQSLGVRIGRAEAEAPASVSSGDAGAKGGLVHAEDTSTRCPFGAMLSGPETAPQPASIRWTSTAEARLANIPSFVRPMARTGIEEFARERGALEVDDAILDAAREHFGM
jgi:hypothetical protein